MLRLDARLDARVRATSFAARLWPTKDDVTDSDGPSRWVLLSALIGVVAGLGAAGLYAGVQGCTHLVLTPLGGYRPYVTSGEGGFRRAGSIARPWAIPLVVATGALVSAIVVRAFAPEAGGHGTDAAIDAALHRPLGVRLRVAFVKLAASALTLGSGGSGGTEGPAAQISAAFGSTAARLARLTPAQARSAVVIGLASGIGAVFRAPLGGALLGAELLYRRDADPKAVPRALPACAAAYGVFGALIGPGPVLGHHTAAAGPAVLVAVAVVGLAAGAAGRMYAACFYAVHDAVAVRSRSTAARLAWPFAGGLVTGSIALAVPSVLGTNYGFMQAATDRGVLLSMPLWGVLLLAPAKTVATAASIGTGGSGGVFGPGLVTGAGVGAALWRLADLAGVAPHDPTVFVVVGMAACLGPIVRAPLGVLVMAAETVGDASMLAPAVVGTLCACLVVGRRTLYRSQAERRAESPAPAAAQVVSP